MEYIYYSVVQKASHHLSYFFVLSLQLYLAIPPIYFSKPQMIQSGKVSIPPTLFRFQIFAVYLTIPPIISQTDIQLQNYAVYLLVLYRKHPTILHIFFVLSQHNYTTNTFSKLKIFYVQISNFCSVSGYTTNNITNSITYFSSNHYNYITNIFF